eukprot:CAMPEP_0119124244 /NCGR_PEP_ID=MMETSP1310-20130426/3928_1 /TAXON_ID=464262 /ORGANISM="Genus nov. species nov., Strain RCC2339" /LENGTH=254 /DNA_ID=CAMNT_0007114167 /DNA_START=32 /DNA_END=793 /DNA_ORIENTATION=-
MEVIPVPVLQDNYAYLLVSPNGKECVAIDPAEADKVLEAADKHELSVIAVLTTHHHWDHSGGNSALLKLIQEREKGKGKESASIKVYGGDDRIEAVSHIQRDGTIEVLEGVKVEILFTPCHTSGHVLYRATTLADDTGVLFTGDTLFIGGCGRFFEGTAEQMKVALCDVILSLPDATKIYCGHEYTLSNLKFAISVEPGNAVLQDYAKEAKEKRENGEYTIPSTVKREKEINPFMRLTNAEIRQSLGFQGKDVS